MGSRRIIPSLLLPAVMTLLLPRTAGSQQHTPVSSETQTCIDCHEQYTPGIVADWRASRHAHSTPREALTRSALERRVSSITIPSSLEAVAVGCYECHSQNAKAHKDNFEHFGFSISIIVSPGDCKTCHATEVEQYSTGKKAFALDILQKNPVYQALVGTTLTTRAVHGDRLTPGNASTTAKNEACYACHGTRVEVVGAATMNTEAGELTVPKLSNWPNQGVGRINPDGTSGACTSCHPRHSFAIEIARKPATCGQCHLEPDVPAYNVYKESKHGNIEESVERHWTWDSVPWTVGKDFTAPTCATCHNSLLVNPAGGVIAERSHDFGARTWIRIFGLVYAHPQPASGKTFEIRNDDGLPLPTTFAGKPASTFLISSEDQAKRKELMKKVCGACHSSSWTSGHFTEFDSTISETNAMTLAATQIIGRAWEKKMADRSNPFDEAIEQMWVRQWLFYANSVRYGSAMAGPDYTAFKNGWWELTNNLQKMHETVKAGKRP